jgi:hypothetical protein
MLDDTQTRRIAMSSLVWREIYVYTRFHPLCGLEDPHLQKTRRLLPPKAGYQVWTALPCEQQAVHCAREQVSASSGG